MKVHTETHAKVSTCDLNSQMQQNCKSENSMFRHKNIKEKLQFYSQIHYKKKPMSI